ncbi:Winged helix DNA-binding domain-containing protein [Arachidicoccus rhizosphaerae]|uniref:Winged helix DNA-binding domain-containing protein n=1 Tax=Arachidicoccus rhizosphaerae TaxID=551991 RepID=A0A1H3X7R2_9BACT|nr:winged helix DNA-binding domain-containing protein [Arachidicoccus rhizosphaerae]SDZ95455.1 Winged helix DNA-binding domain-containing protein [Arachidicoccus rhizosphaerae]
MASTSKVKLPEGQQHLLDARIDAQHLSVHEVLDVAHLVQRMGALQAQHFDMVQWAICHRLGHCAEAKFLTGAVIQKAFEKGHIVRTHALRPTWQLLAGEDLLWILHLTAPAIKKALFSRDKHLGILQQEYAKADEAIYRILSDEPYLSKAELVSHLEQRGFSMDEYRSNHYIMHAELEGIICSGAVKNEKHSYGLVENMLGKNMEKALRLKKELQGAAGVRELASRYFSTRGPASVADFAWWSGLNITEIKKALVELGDQLVHWEKQEVNKKTENSSIKNTDLYYWSDVQSAGKSKSGGSKPGNSSGKGDNLHLLAAFDEYLISYKDRSAMLAPEFNRQIITVNGMFRPAVVRNGKILASWQVEKTTAAKSAGKVKSAPVPGLKIKILPFTTLKSAEIKTLLKGLEPEVELFARFKNMPLMSFQIAK